MRSWFLDNSQNNLEIPTQSWNEDDLDHNLSLNWGREEKLPGRTRLSRRIRTTRRLNL